jgi:nitrite reductase/ring-hydroxylating ferredoxin subunit
VCRRDELQPGEMRAFQLDRTRVVVCRTGDSFKALRDICPHQGAQLSGGLFGGTNVPSEVGEYEFGRAGEIVRCPRHGFEFDVCTGLSLHDPDHMRVKTYPVVEQGDELYVDLGDGR